jgi:hypothetical protein
VYNKHDYIQRESIGTGWLFYRDDGKMSIPHLFYDDGTEMPSGEYILASIDESLVVIPRRKQ